jgi:hypothetical protein
MAAAPARHEEDAAAASPLQDKAEHVAGLLSLSDDLLLVTLAALDPLPDRFSAGRTCRRLHRLVSSDALRVIVSPSVAAAGAPGTRRAPRPACRAVFLTVEEAVAASRPGDTLVLEAGMTHACADVTLTWPLRLTGGVLQRRHPAEEATGPAQPPPLPPTLAAPPSTQPSTILDVAASAHLAGLRIQAPAAGGSCIWHRAGTLRISSCFIEATAAAHSGLAFLHSPIFSSAVDGTRDRIDVEETRMAGAPGTQAASVLGHLSASVHDVRVVPLPGRRGSLFWLSVKPWGVTPGSLDPLMRLRGRKLSGQEPDSVHGSNDACTLSCGWVPPARRRKLACLSRCEGDVAGHEGERLPLPPSHMDAAQPRA